MDSGRTNLLVSVRSAEEARIALAGGADLIDVKEPSRGSLGRADADVIQGVLAAVGGRRPVSAALGEWDEDEGILSNPDLRYVKWGLARCGRSTNWRHALAKALDTKRRPEVVLAAYADWQCAQAPPLEEVFALACDHPGSVLLIDTHCKDAQFGKSRPTLLDWLPIEAVEDLCARARDARVKIALAGSLGLAEICSLRKARPDWFAVRGAVCDDGNRQAGVQRERVSRLAAILNRPQVDDPYVQVR